jgi:hypothetical protein
MRPEAASSVATNSTTAKRYINFCVQRFLALGPQQLQLLVGILCLNCPLQRAKTISDCDFVTVVRKKQISPSPVNASAIANTKRNHRIRMIGVRSFSHLSVVHKSVSRKSLFVSLFAIEVTSTDVEKSLKDQLHFSCARLQSNTIRMYRFISLLQKIICALNT